MGQFLLFFAGILLSMITGIFGNWSVCSWYYHQDHPELNQRNKYIPIAGFTLILLATFYVFYVIATQVPQL